MYTNLQSVKGTRCLGSVELVHEERLEPFVMKSIMVALKVELNDPCTQTCLEIVWFSLYFAN